MNDEDKSKELLINELKELRQEINSLKKSCKTEITECNQKVGGLLEDLEAFRSIIEKNSEAIIIIEPDGIPKAY